METILTGLAVAAFSVLVGFLVNHYGPKLLAGRKPLAIHVETDPLAIWGDAPDWDPYACVIEGPVSEVGGPPPPRCRAWWAWAQQIGAVDALETTIQVTIVGRAKSTVIIDGLRLRTYVRRSALDGSALVCRTGGADMVPRGIDVNLDDETIAFIDHGGEPLEGPLLLTVKEGEAEALHIRARANHYSVEWDCDLEYIVGGKRHAFRISPERGHFVTTGLQNARMYEWTDGEWVPLEM